MMKNLIYILFFMVMLPCVSLGQHSSFYDQALTSLKEKNYFLARSLYTQNGNQMNVAEKLVIKAYTDNAFNRPKSSNVAITSFFKHHAKGSNDSLKLELLRLKQINHARLFNYAKAYKVNNEILTKHIGLLSEKDRTDYQNTAIIWKSLIQCPKQHIKVAERTVIKMNRDKASLPNLKISSNGIYSDFIFDTGANFSTVTETTAKAFKMQTLQGIVEVGTITGAKVNSHLALCRSFSIGNIVVRNAVFLVMPDSALAFPQINYQINGIIGFPVIEGLKEVQLTSDDEFIVPKMQYSSDISNMALEFLTPIINLGDEYFTFDTGATETMLYSKYFKKHELDISREYVQDDLKFGGAGGLITKKGYNITYHPVIAGKQLVLRDVHVFSDKFMEDKDHFYGNIGQDIIKQFNKMTINFSQMYIRFE